MSKFNLMTMVEAPTDRYIDIFVYYGLYEDTPEENWRRHTDCYWDEESENFEDAEGGRVKWQNFEKAYWCEIEYPESGA